MTLQDRPAPPGSSMKILIDPSYVNPRPYHLLGKFSGLPLDRIVPPWLWKSAAWTGPFPAWAFGPDGFDGMDLGFTYTNLFRPDLSIREEVLERYRNCRWPIRSFHATFAGEARLFRETALNLAEDGERTRRGVRNQIRAAREIGGAGSVLVLHPGVVRTDPARDRERATRTLEDCLPRAEREQVILALENMPRSVGGPRYLGGDYEELRRLLDRLPSRFLKVCIDLGHANNYAEIKAREQGETAPERYLARFGYLREMIQELGQDIVYAHVHYNRSHTRTGEARVRNCDEHMPLTRVPPEEWAGFRLALGLLRDGTSVARTGFVNLELIPRRMFGLYPVLPTGSTLQEQIGSVRLLREALASPATAARGLAPPRYS